MRIRLILLLPTLLAIWLAPVFVQTPPDRQQRQCSY